MTPLLPPDQLRPDLIRRIEAMSEAELRLVHQVLLHAEKERLWRELSEECEADRHRGRMEKLPEIIREVRAEMHAA